MHDCPGCRVPLHGYEEVCPSCGTKQVVRKSFKSLGKLAEPGVNPWPFVVTFVIIGIVLVVGAQSSWIGQMMRQGPVQEDPMDKLTYTDARQMIESKLNEGLAAVGAKGKYTWTGLDGNPADKNANASMTLNVETKLADRNQRHAIIDPVKEYMAKALVSTLIMKDTKSGATWTYTVQLPMEGPKPSLVPPTDEPATKTAAPQPEAEPQAEPQAEPKPNPMDEPMPQMPGMSTDNSGS